jgi:hypothetical protein
VIGVGRHFEQRHLEVDIPKAGDGGQVGALPLLAGDQDHAEQVAVEGDRAVDVRDGKAGVRDAHQTRRPVLPLAHP